MAIGTKEQLVAHYSLVLKTFSTQLFWNDCFLTFFFYFLIISEYNSEHYSKCSICHSCLAVIFSSAFPSAAVLFTTNSLSHFPVLNIALQCFTDHIFSLKQLFPLTFLPLTYKSERKGIRIKDHCHCCGPSCWLHCTDTVLLL